MKKSTMSGVGSLERRIGHSNVAVTSVYLHMAVYDEDGVGNLFAFE